MNLLAQADQLKSLSDQQLAMERGRVPEYLLVAELQRRDQMRKAYQADMAAKQGGSKGTVADELWQQVMQPQPQQMMPMGGGAPPQQAMSAGGLIQRLASGGMVRYADGGTTPKVARTLEDLAAMRGPAPDLAALRQQAEEAYGPDALSGIAAEMAAQKAQAVVNKPSIWQALIQMGAGMMASRNPTPLGGLGEGLSQGLGRYVNDRDLYRQDQIRMQEQAARNLNARAGLAEAMNRRQAGIAGLANDAAHRAASQGNVNAQLLQQSGLAEMNDAHQSAMQKAQQDFMSPYYQSQITENNAQAERYRQQAAQQDALMQAYLKRAGGDPAKAQMMMLRDKAQAEYIQPVARLNPIDEAAYNELRAQGLSAAEARNRMNSGRTMESERKAVANVLNIVDRDMREWKKDPMGGMKATSAEEAERRRNLTLNLATQAGVLDLILERESKAGASQQQPAPATTGAKSKIKILGLERVK